MTRIDAAEHARRRAAEVKAARIVAAARREAAYTGRALAATIGAETARRLSDKGRACKTGPSGRTVRLSSRAVAQARQARLLARGVAVRADADGALAALDPRTAGRAARLSALDTLADIDRGRFQVTSAPSPTTWPRPDRGRPRPLAASLAWLTADAREAADAIARCPLTAPTGGSASWRPSTSDAGPVGADPGPWNAMNSETGGVRVASPVTIPRPAKGHAAPPAG